MSTPKILLMSGSIRSGSINTRLLASIMGELSRMDCEVTRISLEDYALPIYNGDDEGREGVPDNAVKLAGQFHGHDGFFMTSPEYNGSLPPLLKNAIDWTTRVGSHPDGKELVPFRGKAGAIGCASPGAQGGVTMLYHLRDVLMRLGVLIMPEQVSVPFAMEGFDEMDRIKDDRARGFLEATCQALVERASRLGD